MESQNPESLEDTITKMLDPEKLKAEIEDPELNEKYILLRKTHDYKLGIVVKKGIKENLIYTLELLLCALRGTSEVDVYLLERTTRISHRLVEWRYSLNHQGDGWILCEKSLKHSQIIDECVSLYEELERI